MGEEIKVSNISEQFIKSKMNLLKKPLEPLIEKVRTLKMEDGWEKYRWKLYLIHPITRTRNTLQNNWIFSVIVLLLIAFIGALLTTHVEVLSKYLLELVEKMNNEIITNMLTNNGEKKLDKQINGVATFLISTVPALVLIVTPLYIRNLSALKKEMLDPTKDVFSLGYFKNIYPSMYTMADSFSSDGFTFKQIESYLESAKEKALIDSDFAEIIKEAKELKDEYEELKKKSEIFNEGLDILNGLFDAANHNFNRLSTALIEDNYENFELNLSIISPNFAMYKFEEGTSKAKRIARSGKNKLDKSYDINANKNQPFIDLYLKNQANHQHILSEDSTKVSYLVRMENKEIWVITYYLSEKSEQQVNFLLEDDTIEVENYETIYSVKNVYEQVRKHLILMFHMEEKMASSKGE
ncbi:hypothetical protein ACFWAE_21110 [Priestia megaterium]|uniref:hypothetical protein n=1 Tax=Priestia megaterium TaxID=1404 RepID=UPI0036714BAB